MFLSKIEMLEQSIKLYILSYYIIIHSFANFFRIDTSLFFEKRRLLYIQIFGTFVSRLN